jgi:hypothetical protein
MLKSLSILDIVARKSQITGKGNVNELRERSSGSIMLRFLHGCTVSNQTDPN